MPITAEQLLDVLVEAEPCIAIAADGVVVEINKPDEVDAALILAGIARSWPVGHHIDAVGLASAGHALDAVTGEALGRVLVTYAVDHQHCVSRLLTDDGIITDTPTAGRLVDACAALLEVGA